VDRRPTDTSAQDAYLAGDNTAFGKVAAEYLAKALNGNGNIVVLRGIPFVKRRRTRFFTYPSLDSSLLLHKFGTKEVIRWGLRLGTGTSKNTTMSKLTGKVAIVTGASKGIGAAIAKALAAEGASVVVNYASSKDGADAVVAAISAAGGKAVAVHGDVSKGAEAQGIIDAAIKNYGRLDILVNNSGVYEFAPIEAITEEQFHRIFNINVLGLILTTQAAVKHLGEGGSIINIGSVVSRITPPGSSVYTGTKGAVDAITGVLSRELGPKNIRVNTLNPGMVETEGTHSGGFIGSEFEAATIAQTPLGRVGQPDDIASIAIFLASDDSAWLTGERIIAGGGLR
jgi:3-oxoacyl-[acyl-carrier protein] reductase